MLLLVWFKLSVFMPVHYHSILCFHLGERGVLDQKSNTHESTVYPDSFAVTGKTGAHRVAVILRAPSKSTDSEDRERRDASQHIRVPGVQMSMRLLYFSDDMNHPPFAEVASVRFLHRQVLIFPFVN